jgi:arylsulfatase A-like enzyme
MIIFISDHGEMFGEHGIIKKVAPWHYDELSRVPLIISLPDRINEKKRINSFVRMPDIAPTILGFFNLKVPPIMQGRNLLHLIQGEEEGMKFGISGYHGQSWSIRNYEWSFYTWLRTQFSGTKVKPELYRYDPDFVPSEPSKFNLEDKAEKENLIDEKPETAQSLKKELQDFIGSLIPSVGDLMAKDHWRLQKDYMERQLKYLKKI